MGKARLHVGAPIVSDPQGSTRVRVTYRDGLTKEFEVGREHVDVGDAREIVAVNILRTSGVAAGSFTVPSDGALAEEFRMLHAWVPHPVVRFVELEADSEVSDDR